MIDLKEELYNLLEKNQFNHLPSQALIDEDERVAKAVWKNYYEDGTYYDSDSGRNRYTQIFKLYSWGEILGAYKENVQFWVDNIQFRFEDFEILLNPQFQKDFPVIVNHFLNDSDILLSQFKESKNFEFFKKIKNPSAAAIEIHKELLLKDYDELNQESFLPYKEDRDFVKKALLTHYSAFEWLDIEQKKDKEFIKAALTYNYNVYNRLSESLKNDDEIIIFGLKKNNFDFYNMLNETQKNQYIDIFFRQLDVDNIKFKNLKDLPSHYQLEAFEKKPSLIRPALNDFFETFKSLVEQAFIKDIKKSIEYCNDKFINYFIAKPENIALIKPQLNNYINNLAPESEQSNDFNKMLTLISVDKNLSEKLEKNIFYKLMLKSGQKGTAETFNQTINELILLVDTKVISNIQAEQAIKIEYDNLAPDIKRELKISKKNLWENVRGQKIKDRLEQNLPVHEVEVKKNKI